jgi:hypothetical protein
MLQVSRWYVFIPTLLAVSQIKFFCQRKGRKKITWKTQILLGDLMFCWPCIIVYQCNKTNVMHFSFSLLRIKGPVHVSSITCSSLGGVTQTAFGILRAYNVSCSAVARLQFHFNRTTALQLTYARHIRNAVCSVPPEDEQVMLETCRGPWFSINWIKSASRWFHCTNCWDSSIKINLKRWDAIMANEFKCFYGENTSRRILLRKWKYGWNCFTTWPLQRECYVPWSWLVY